MGRDISSLTKLLPNFKCRGFMTVGRDSYSCQISLHKVAFQHSRPFWGSLAQRMPKDVWRHTMQLTKLTTRNSTKQSQHCSRITAVMAPNCICLIGTTPLMRSLKIPPHMVRWTYPPDLIGPFTLHEIIAWHNVDKS